METSKQLIIRLLKEYDLQHEVHEFPSGCTMIDFWINKNLYVVQDEIDRIGFSFVNEPNLSTIADEYFTDVNIVLEKIKKLIVVAGSPD